MLRDILKFIYEKGFISLSVISTELNIPLNLVESSIEQLIRMDYLIKDEKAPSCGSACVSCPYASSCNKDIITSYTIADKGINFINK